MKTVPSVQNATDFTIKAPWTVQKKEEQTKELIAAINKWMATLFDQTKICLMNPLSWTFKSITLQSA